MQLFLAEQEWAGHRWGPSLVEPGGGGKFSIV